MLAQSTSPPDTKSEAWGRSVSKKAKIGIPGIDLGPVHQPTKHRARGMRAKCVSIVHASIL